MKERPDPNYLVRIQTADPAVEVQLPGAFHVSVNVAIGFVLVPQLPVAWPPTYLEAEDVKTVDDAARYLLATSQIAVTPGEGDEVRVDGYADPGLPDTPRSLLRLPAARYAALADDVARLHAEKLGEFVRLDDLGARPLARFLREDLPRANLDANERALLCLVP